MEISVRISGGRASGKTTLLRKIDALISETYQVSKVRYHNHQELIPEETLYMEFTVR